MKKRTTMYFMIFGIISSILLTTSFAAAETEDSITINGNSWDYLQLKVSGESSISINFNSDHLIKFFVFSEDNFELYEMDQSSIIESLEESEGFVNNFNYEYLASKNTILYVVLVNDNSESTTISYNYEFDNPTIPGYNLMWLFGCFAFTLFIILIQKGKKGRIETQI